MVRNRISEIETMILNKGEMKEDIATSGDK